MAAVSSTLFELLFMQIALKALADSRPPEGAKGRAAAGGEKADQEAAFYRIEQLGFQIGQRLVERLLHRDAPALAAAGAPGDPFAQHIDIVKYICKEFWLAALPRASTT